ncbi:MAG TPA: glycosyltransferase [Thermoanaerobaculia bacterium]|nr:glycosyltransferase [Thermoanaerobaculia bacterium]
MQPLVSIVLPVIEPHRRYFREAVESVVAQTLPDFELLLIEDPSLSSGVESLSGLSDPRIRHVVNRARTSLPEQHNLGLSMCRAPFICRFDADDVCEQDRLERQLAFLQANPDVSIVSSALRVIDEEGRTIGFRRYPVSHDEILRAFPFSNPIANSAVMFRREVYERFGGWRTDSPLPAQDYEWYSRVAIAGVRFANLVDPLVRYRLHAGSIKSTKLRETLRSTLETKRRYWSNDMGLKARAVMFGERLLLHLPPRLVFALFSRLRYGRLRGAQTARSE